jgi:hypothetical protein
MAAGEVQSIRRYAHRTVNDGLSPSIVVPRQSLERVQADYEDGGLIGGDLGGGVLACVALGVLGVGEHTSTAGPLAGSPDVARSTGALSTFPDGIDGGQCGLRDNESYPATVVARGVPTTPARLRGPQPVSCSGVSVRTI